MQAQNVTLRMNVDMTQAGIMLQTANVKALDSIYATIELPNLIERVVYRTLKATLYPSATARAELVAVLPVDRFELRILEVLYDARFSSEEVSSLATRVFYDLSVSLSAESAMENPKIRPKWLKYVLLLEGGMAESAQGSLSMLAREDPYGLLIACEGLDSLSIRRVLKMMSDWMPPETDLRRHRRSIPQKVWKMLSL